MMTTMDVSEWTKAVKQLCVYVCVAAKGWITHVYTIHAFIYMHTQKI